MKLSLTTLLVIIILGFAASPVSAECTEGDCANGSGTFEYPNGGNYVGEFKENYPHGEGVLIYPDGSKYAGSFENNELHGKGIYT
ncbi:MAG: hypothetical protein LC633_08735, partial [Desulfobulbaceae bacterium]|nr:hypothetical protein [Desulfobulbaceae bacterium]